MKENSLILKIHNITLTITSYNSLGYFQQNFSGKEL